MIDKGKRKRIADIAEKLGVGLLLGASVQGIFAEKITAFLYVGGAVMIVVAFTLLAVAIAFSRED